MEGEILDKTLDELNREIAVQKVFPSKSVFDNLFGTDTYSLKYITVEKTGEEFYTMLLRLIDERFGGKTSAVYTKAELTRQDFYRLGINRKPPKRETVLKFIIALKLNLEDATALFRSAGYVWGPALKTDLVIKACVENGIYDTFKVDEELIHNGQKALFSVE